MGTFFFFFFPTGTFYRPLGSLFGQSLKGLSCRFFLLSLTLKYGIPSNLNLSFSWLREIWLSSIACQPDKAPQNELFYPKAEFWKALVAFSLMQNSIQICQPINQHASFPATVLPPGRSLCSGNTELPDPRACLLPSAFVSWFLLPEMLFCLPSVSEWSRLSFFKSTTYCGKSSCGESLCASLLPSRGMLACCFTFLSLFYHL